jgi:hypothetical protein
MPAFWLVSLAFICDIFGSVVVTQGTEFVRDILDFRFAQ